MWPTGGLTTRCLIAILYIIKYIYFNLHSILVTSFFQKKTKRTLVKFCNWIPFSIYDLPVRWCKKNVTRKYLPCDKKKKHLMIRQCFIVLHQLRHMFLEDLWFFEEWKWNCFLTGSFFNLETFAPFSNNVTGSCIEKEFHLQVTLEKAH